MTNAQENEDGFQIIRIEGRLDAATSREFDAAMATLMREGGLRVALDVSELTYVSSAGLRSLLMLAKKMKDAAGLVALFKPQPQVSQLLKMAGFDRVMPMFHEESILRGFLRMKSTGGLTGDQVSQIFTHPLSVAEEFFLLALDDATGQLRPLPPGVMERAMAGALLMELAFLNRLEVDLKELRVTNRNPIGDPVLDDVLEDMATSSGTHSPAYWLERVGAQGAALVERVRERLVHKRILKEENRRMLWVFSVRRYPVMKDRREVKEVKARLHALVCGGDIPDPLDVLILNLASICKLLDVIFIPEELPKVGKRIGELVRLDLIGQELAASLVGKP